MKKTVLIFFTIQLVCPCIPQKDWWENVQLYQIYPRSFMDSDGDGIGDLRGVIMKLHHLEDSGVQAAWLSPIFLSPMADFGYDISDFRKIHPEYGTMEDFEELTRKAKDVGIKIILDFVPNHSSDEHIWFQLSANRTAGYEDYYVWDDGKPDPKNPRNRIPPNNWNSLFRGSAWKWNEERQQFYLHQFDVKQPDLNFRNPKVVQEMKDILIFWLDRGASGFRVDAIPHLFETDKARHGGVHPDEPLSGATDNLDDYGSLNHIYTRDQPETYDMIVQWRQTLDEYQRVHGGETRVMMTEAYGSVDLIMKYFGNATHPGAHFPFNFDFITSINRTSNAQDVLKAVENWFDNIPPHVNQISNWVIGNHDNRRMASRFGRRRADGMTMLVQLLPGIGVTYQGDEIAMEDHWLSWEDTVDPQACNTNPRDYEPHSRDPGRTPFQWDNTKNAGFSKANRTWLPVAENYKMLNLKTQNEAYKSHYKVYQQLSALRKKKTFKDGTFNIVVLTNGVLAFKRELVGYETYVVVLNLFDQDEVVDLNKLSNLPSVMTVVLSSSESEFEKGDDIYTSALYLEPYESLVLRSEEYVFERDLDLDVVLDY